MSGGRRATTPVRYAAIALPLLAASTSTALAQERLVVLEEPASTAVGVAVVLGAGSALEADDQAGITQLAALALLEQLRTQFDVLGARATVECDRSTIAFTLLLPPSTWRAAVELFLGALFDYRVEDGAVSRARAELLRRLSVERGNPAFEVQHALQRALYGEHLRWASATCGRHETLATLPADSVRRIGRARFSPERAAAAVAGPISAGHAPSVFGALADPAWPTLPLPPPRPQPQGRQFIERETVTTWVALGFPFAADTRSADDAAGTELEAQRLLAFYLRDLIRPSPARPEVYDAAAELARNGGGGTLSVRIVTAPDRALGWAERVGEIVDRLAHAMLPDPAFESLLRRYHGERLLALATPEARARDAARQLIFEHGYRPPARRIDALTPERLRRAAASLGPPTSVLLGPGNP